MDELLLLKSGKFENIRRKQKEYFKTLVEAMVF